MTRKIRMISDVGIHDLAKQISDLENKDISDLVKEIDGLVADYKFTKSLRDYFVKEIENEDAHGNP